MDPASHPTDELYRIPPELRQRFDVLDVIGSGGMGAVLRVRDRVLGREVALKLLLAERWANPEHRSRFLREAQAAARLDHPGIVTVHDVDSEGRLLVMELAGGGDLRRWIKREGSLPAAEIKRVGVELAGALAAAHDAGIVHRDVKPSNVLFDPSGAVRLADFGIASVGDSELTSTGTRIGTPAYMAPEQLRARAVDHRADVYAAGATLYEAATGAKLHGDRGRTRDVYGAVLAATGDRVLARAIALATMERPDDRFQAMSDLAAALGSEPDDDLEVPLSDSARAALARFGRRRAGRRVGRRGWLMAGAAGLMVGAVAAALVAIGDRRDRDPGPMVVAVVPAEVQGDAEIAASGREIPALLVEGLTGSPGLEIRAPASFVPDPQPDDAAGWIAAARAAGAERVVTSAVSAGGDGTATIAFAVTGASGEVLREMIEVAPLEDLEARVTRMAPIIAAALAATRSPPLDGRTAADDYHQGVAATRTGEWAAADRFLQSALARDPTLDQARYYLAIVGWWWSSAIPRMRALTRAALEAEISEAEKSVVRGIDMLIDSRFFEARDHFETLARQTPDDRHVLYGLIEARFHSGDPAAAMEAYRRLVAIAPEFQPAFVHAARYFLARREREGFEATAGARPLDREWTVRETLAFEGVARARDKALAMLEQRNAADREELRELLAELEAQSFRPGAARVYLDRPEDAKARWAIAVATGDHERVAALREVAFGNAGATTEPWRRRDGFARLALIEVGTGSDRDRRATAKKLAEAAAEASIRGGLELRSEVARTLLAGVLDDRAELDQRLGSRFPEVAAIAEAYRHRRAGRHAEAAAAWRRALDLNSSGYAYLIERLELARDLVAAGDHHGAAGACAEVIDPGLFDWSWAGAIGPCLEISIAAAEALGQPERAEALRQKQSALASGST